MEKLFSKLKRIPNVVIFLILSIATGIVLLFLLLWNPFGGNSVGMIKQNSYSTLISTNEIAALSVSEFVYNGIAQSVKSNGEIDYNVMYKSTVKASVDANSISFVMDEGEKRVTFILPEFTIENPVINVGSIKFIPDREDLHMDNVIALCRRDALDETRKSDKFISIAQENLESILEAWYSPVLEGYSFEYQYETAKAGETE